MTSLYTIIQAQVVTKEVLATVLIVEGILNSRPLGYVFSDVADLDPVTPNFLLMGRPDPSLSQAVYDSSELLSHRQWRHSQMLVDQFWTHFVRHTMLQTRSKWQQEVDNLQLGAVVMIVEPQLPQALWSVGPVASVI